MPQLKDPSQELFAQGIANGKSQRQAYQDAGYGNKNPDGAASRLAKEQKIIDRVSELQAKQNLQVQHRTAFTREMAVDFMLGLAKSAAASAREIHEVDANGKTVRKRDANAGLYREARAAASEAAKLMGFYPQVVKDDPNSPDIPAAHVNIDLDKVSDHDRAKAIAVLMSRSAMARAQDKAAE